MGEYKKGHFTHAQIKHGDQVYMDRWYILCFPRMFSIRIHHIMLPDSDRWPHDHPWSFFSIILKGGYTEYWCTPDGFRVTWLPEARQNVWSKFSQRYVGRWSFHRSTDLHRIIQFNDEARGAWTLIFTGPEHREWGFRTDRGWVSRLSLNLGAHEPNGPEPD
jgi:hypothetical protein